MKIQGNIKDIKYRGFEIHQSTEEWALYCGYFYYFKVNDRTMYHATIEDAINEIDEILD